MRTPVLLAAVLTACLTVTSSQIPDHWIKSVPQLGLNITFACNDSKNPEDSSFDEYTTVEGWMLPEYKFIKSGEAKDHVVVSDDGLNITITSITVADFGIYHCLWRDPSDSLHMIKWGLNVKGPYFVDLWEKYQLNVIIACSASFGFLAIIAFLSVIYHFRWRPQVTGLDICGQAPSGSEDLKPVPSVTANVPMAEAMPPSPAPMLPYDLPDHIAFTYDNADMRQDIHTTAM